MKIHEVESLLGITKANIRFYEKEGLLSPARKENGYRDYSQDHITRLKQIIILRKLGFPVSAISEILDGALPLQTALDSNIQALQEEIETLNGSLMLCRQMKEEDAHALDTERYWETIQSREAQGNQFQSLVEDYLKFSEVNYQWLFWPLPVEDLRSPRKVCLFILGISLLNSLSEVISNDTPFLSAYVHSVFIFLRGVLLWTVIFVPLYILSKKRPKLANGIMTALLVLVPIAVIAIIVWFLTFSYQTING